MTRTDIHAPGYADFDPQAYDFTGAVLDLGTDDPTVNEDAREILDGLAAKGHEFASVHGMGRCDHCGAWLRYTAVLLHQTTGQLLYVGQTCLGSRFSGMSKGEFDRLRKAAAAARQTAAKLKGFNDALEASSVMAAAHQRLALMNSQTGYYWGRSANILADIMRKCRHYGNGPSEGQERLLAKLMTDLDRYEEESRQREAAWAAAREAKAARPNAFQGNVGDKKQAFTGEVVGLLEIEREVAYNVTAYATKIEILTEGGTVLWWASKGLYELEVKEGETLTLTGTIKAHEEYNGTFQTVLTRCKISR